MHDKPIDDTELARLGISRVPSHSFHWQGFRYSNASDAIAAATREAKR